LGSFLLPKLKRSRYCTLGLNNRVQMPEMGPQHWYTLPFREPQSPSLSGLRSVWSWNLSLPQSLWASFPSPSHQSRHSGLLCVTVLVPCSPASSPETEVATLLFLSGYEEDRSGLQTVFPGTYPNPDSCSRFLNGCHGHIDTFIWSSHV
jgi:hypothetical protein